MGKKGGNLALIFVPLDEAEGQDSDPLARILREYVACTGEAWLQYEKEKHNWEEQHVNATQTKLLEIHMKAMKELMAMGFSGDQASQMLARPISVDSRHFS